MADQHVLDQLISTYSTLNHQVRIQSEDQLLQGVPSARTVIRQMRDDELRFSQDLKARLTGQPVSFAETHQLPSIGTETDHDSTASLIAQFGTAREATLALLQTVGEEQWDSTEDGYKSIRADVQTLADRDRKALDSIISTIGVTTG